MRRCEKRRYRDKVGALFALSQTKDNTRREKSEHGTYHCRSCNGWHLTSKVGMR